MPMFSMRDELTGFTTPVVEVSEEVAERNFRFAVQRNEAIQASPADYSLYRIGTMNTETGLIAPEIPPKMLVRANSILRGEKE